MRAALALLALLLLTLPAEARPQPALYFLADGDLGPAGDGVLKAEMPGPTNASIRPVLPAVEEDLTVFLGNATQFPTIRGPLYVGYWPGPSFVLDGNITATVYLVKDDERTPLGSISFNATTDPESINATALIPPNPSDPEGSIAYLQAQAFQQLLKPPKLLVLGVVNVPVEEGSVLMLGLRFDAREGGLPIQLGLPTVQYDSALSPTFLYVPWYEPDPPKTTTTKSTTGKPGSTTTPRSTTSSPGSTSDSPTEDSPGLLAPALLLALVAVALRRRSA